MNTRINAIVTHAQSITATVAAGLVLATLSTAAVAGPKCEGDQPKMDAEEVKSIYIEKGYEIKNFKTSSGGCYEIYGYLNGEKVEVYIDPWTAAALETK